MSLALIQESAKEVRRLAIAGSPLAVGDFRLKKLILPLEQAGAKVPVFAQVAKAMSDLVNGPESDSASRLLTLSTLLNAILYTQGSSTAEGELRDFEEFPSACACTQTTSRVLKPLIQALTSSGGGRLDIIRSAFERGATNDLRLIDPAIHALGDSFPEIADLVANKILPAYGPGIVPRLKASLDLKGKRHDARKLLVMHRLDPAGTLELCKTALDDGSPDVKAAAIECIGDHDECLPLVMEHANSKNKQLRVAALCALARHDRPELTTIFSELIKGKTLGWFAAPLRVLRIGPAFNLLLGEGRRMLAAALNGEAERLQRFSELLTCLETRKEPEVEQFLIESFGAADKLSKVKAKNSPFSGLDILTLLAIALYKIGSPKALEAILSQREIVSNAGFVFVFRSALRLWPAAKVYDEYSRYLGQTKGAAKEKSDVIFHAISSSNWVNERGLFTLFLDLSDEDSDNVSKIEWDPRWLDAAIKADQLQLVCVLSRPNHKGALDYLLNVGPNRKLGDAEMIVRALTIIGYPKVTDFFLDLVSKMAKSSKRGFELTYLLNSAQHLPKSDLPKLDQFATKLEGDLVDRFLEAIAPLRSTAANP